MLEWQFGVQRSRAGSSTSVESPRRAERPRSRKRRQALCFQAAECRGLGGTERVRAAISSALAEPSALDRPFRALRRSRAGSKSETSAGHCFRAAKPCNFGRPGGSERVREAISNARVEPSGLGQPYRAPQRSRAGSSGHFERSCAAERARCCKRRQVRFFEARPSQLSELNPAARKGSCGNFELYIYIYTHMCVRAEQVATIDTPQLRTTNKEKTNHQQSTPNFLKQATRH